MGGERRKKNPVFVKALTSKTTMTETPDHNFHDTPVIILCECLDNIMDLSITKMKSKGLSLLT